MSRPRASAIVLWILFGLQPALSSGQNAPFVIHYTLTAKPQQFWVKPEDGPDGVMRAPVGAIREMEEGNFNNLERDMAYLLETKEQLPDGTFRIETIPKGIFNGTRIRGSSEDAAMEPIRLWEKAQPDSPEAPIFEAITWRALAWAARGSTYANEVNPAGMDLFKTRAEQAAKVLIDSKARSSANPLWYLEMQQVGRDFHWDQPRVEAILTEGMRRFPEFHALPEEMVVYLSPKWYGNYDRERAFIQKTVSAASKEQQA